MQRTYREYPLVAPAFVVLLLVLPLSVSASPIMGVTSNTWDPAGDLQGWTNLSGSSLITLTNPSSHLGIQFSARDPWDDVAEDTIYATDSGNTGDLSTVSMGVRFEFYATNVTPGEGDVRVYMKGGTTGLTWYQSFSHPNEGWDWHTVSFEYPERWEGGTSAEYISDLTNITAIGIFVSSTSLEAHEYRLDSWMYVYVPEPGTVCMLAAAFLSLAIPFRKRLTSGMSLGS